MIGDRARRAGDGVADRALSQARRRHGAPAPGRHRRARPRGTAPRRCSRSPACRTRRSTASTRCCARPRASLTEAAAAGVDDRERGGEARAAADCSLPMSTMWSAPVTAIAAAVSLVAMRPAALAVAAPMLLLWLAAPAIAWWVSRPPAPPRSASCRRRRRVPAQDRRAGRGPSSTISSPRPTTICRRTTSRSIRRGSSRIARRRPTWG